MLAHIGRAPGLPFVTGGGKCKSYTRLYEQGNNMTDRYYALTVALEKDIRDDDAENILAAIKMIKGVLNVKPHISNPDVWMAEERARRELGKKLLDIVFPKEFKNN